VKFFYSTDLSVSLINVVNRYQSPLIVIVIFCLCLIDEWAENSFVEKAKVEQPAKGMPKIYYLK